ncbi:sulfur carrier protein ThiS [Desulfitobacterium hafniense]|uniref:sulfur carrier protein ThiS n=1 Tax=Desulfitobacterium hafniense TaxID=49338 RepID=UPI0003177D58|nr:sulfur carrier protein ThiS [Desulfitobacterium hafniense]
MMKIRVNGQDVLLEKELTVQELLVAQRAEMPEYVTVGINEELIEREDFADRKVREGDSVEFLYFMGGGGFRKAKAAKAATGKEGAA